MSLETDYNFDRRKHRSFKGSSFDIPNIKFVRDKPRMLNFDSKDFADTENRFHKV